MGRVGGLGLTVMHVVPGPGQQTASDARGAGAAARAAAADLLVALNLCIKPESQAQAV